MINRFASLLGICMKAGKVSAGELAAENAIKNGEAKLVILAEDASANTKKKFINSSTYYKVEIIHYGVKEELGRALGKDDRSVVAICNEEFAKKLKGIIETSIETN